MDALAGDSDPHNRRGDKAVREAASQLQAPRFGAWPSATGTSKTGVPCSFGGSSGANLRRAKPHSIHRSSQHHGVAGCAWRPQNGNQRGDLAPGPTTRLARARGAPHPLHTKLLGRPSAPDSYQSTSRPRGLLPRQHQRRKHLPVQHKRRLRTGAAAYYLRGSWPQYISEWGATTSAQ